MRAPASEVSPFDPYSVIPGRGPPDERTPEVWSAPRALGYRACIRRVGAMLPARNDARVRQVQRFVRRRSGARSGKPRKCVDAGVGARREHSLARALRRRTSFSDR